MTTEAIHAVQHGYADVIKAQIENKQANAGERIFSFQKLDPFRSFRNINSIIR